MNRNNLENQLRSLKSKVEVPKGLSDRLISAVSMHELKRKRRRLIFEYLTHGFGSVLIAFFIIRLIAPNFQNLTHIIFGSLILSVCWMIFKVSNIHSQNHFGRIAVSAASFGFLIATAGLYSINGMQVTPLEMDHEVNEGAMEIIDSSSLKDESSVTITSPSDDDISGSEYSGNGKFGVILKINEEGPNMVLQIKLDSGEEVHLPIDKDVYTGSANTDLVPGDHIYVENQFITTLEEEKKLRDALNIKVN